MNRIPRTWMGQDAARTTAGWSVPDLPAQDLSAGRQRLLPPSRVSPQVVQTIQVKAFSNLLVKVFSHFLSRISGQSDTTSECPILPRGKNAIFDIILAMVVVDD